MPRLFIDNRQVEVDDGATILDAADKLGIEIPTMCFLKGYKPSTSCMVCVVEVEGMENFVPACGTVAREGMRVRSNSEGVFQARKMALELLLSDHLGDCLGPCQLICPAQMNIPLMIRQIAAGQLREAIATVKKDIALPAVLGRICPRPCEKGCRRGSYDEPVSICLLKRYVADVDLQSSQPYLPSCEVSKQKRVAIVGAGPAGLAAAYYLQQNGYDCTVFDDHDKPGGMLRYAVPESELPKDVLDKEIAQIEKLGVEFELKARIGKKLSFKKLCKNFDAVFMAIGRLEKSKGTKFTGLEVGSTGITVDSDTYQTNLPGVFAGGDAVRQRQLTVRAVADGKEAAVSIAQYLSGSSVTGPIKQFNTHIGKLQNGEIEIFLNYADKAPCIEPSSQDGGLTDQQARKEAARCLHCDCRKLDSCKLRQYAQEYNARPTRFKDQRRMFVQIQHPDIIYEPGKCIDCGLCIQVTANAAEKLGLTFIGRGFDVRVAVPFDRSITQALENSARQCVKVCPTGALAFKKS